MNEMTGGHTVQSYNEEMNHLHQRVMQIGELVRDQLKRAVDSLEQEDADSAREVIERDSWSMSSISKWMMKSFISLPSASPWPRIYARY